MKEDIIENNVRKHNDSLTGEHINGDAGQLILAILFFLVWILDTFVFRLTTFLNYGISFWVRLPLGLILLGVAGYYAYEGMRIVFGRVPPAPGVIRAGVFSTVRHPIYLGEFLIYPAFLLFSLSLAAGVVTLAAGVFLTFLCKFEEKLLVQRYGEDYRQYMREVPMWFPGFTSRKK